MLNEDCPSLYNALSCLSLDATAAFLTKSGLRPTTVERLQEDILDGAPVNPDGTINLLHYVAWLVRETSRPGG
jgi:hypothetical protein